MRSKSSAPREAPQGDVQTYVLVAGTASIPPGGPGTPEVNLKEGDTVDTHMPLDEMWPEKFAKADGDVPVVSRGSKRAAATRQAKAAAAEAEKEEDTRAPEEQEEADAELDGDDVTDDFADAGDNDLKVTHVVGTGYTIYDGKKAVNAEPLRTKTQVTSRLKDYIGK
jgi:hypothetical protein